MSTDHKPETKPAERSPRTVRYMKYAGAAVGVVFLVKGVSSLIDAYHDFSPTPALVACDADGIAATIKDIAKSRHVVLTSVTHLTAISHTKTTADCTAHITANDNSKALLSYRIVFDGKKNTVHVTGNKPL